jgi:hypothetical protein
MTRRTVAGEQPTLSAAKAFVVWPLKRRFRFKREKNACDRTIISFSAGLYSWRRANIFFVNGGADEDVRCNGVQVTHPLGMVTYYILGRPHQVRILG